MNRKMNRKFAIVIIAVVVLAGSLACVDTSPTKFQACRNPDANGICSCNPGFASGTDDSGNAACVNIAHYRDIHAGK